MYGRGVSSIAEQIKSHDGPVTKADIEEAKKLTNDFFDSYPEGKAWIDKTHEDARKYGFVEDLWGRRRRLPDIQLPKYQFELVNKPNTFNPLLNMENRSAEPDKYLVDKYKEKLDRARTKEARKVVEAEALKEGLQITNNSGFIAQAERQSVNSRIQGGSATITKLAIRNISNDEVMKDLDFHLLIPVHDELIGEAPVWNIEKAKERLAYIMMHAAEPECIIKMKCDADDWTRWYMDVESSHFKEDFEKQKEKGLSDKEAFDLVCEKHCEFEPKEILEAIQSFDLLNEFTL